MQDLATQCYTMLHSCKELKTQVLNMKLVEVKVEVVLSDVLDVLEDSVVEDV